MEVDASRHCSPLSQPYLQDEQAKSRDQTRRGWLERSILNILENQQNVTSESSKNVSKATAGKCIRDTRAGVFTGDAVGHLATM